MRILLSIVISLFPLMVLAVEPDEVLTDPLLEDRARVISKELRCVVCKNQDIDSSNAGVARDLRLLVRERLVAGDSNQEVIEYVRARYGDYVLLKPPFKPSTYLLWLTPPLLFLIAFGAGAIVLSKSRKKAVGRDLSAPDEEEVKRILKRIKDGEKS